MRNHDSERRHRSGGHGSMFTPGTPPLSSRNPDLDPDFDPYSHLGGDQGREPYRHTQGDHASYIGGPGSGSYGYGAGGHGYSGPEDRGMNRDAASFQRGERRFQSMNRSYSSDMSGRNAFSAGYNQQLQRGEHSSFSRDAEQRGFMPPPGPHTGKGPKNYQRADDRICEDACEILTHHGEIDASDIEVSCAGGELTLKGTVSDRRTRRLAEEVAEQVPGVKDIHNELKVKPSEEKA